MEAAAVKQLFVQKAENAGTIVQQVDSEEKALHYAAALAEEKNVKCIACPGLENDFLPLMHEAAVHGNISIAGSSLREHSDTIGMSITRADYGIAATGTLVVVSDSEDIRLATMLPAVHVALLPESGIRKNVREIEPDLDMLLKSEKPSYTAFITGPSRTADIERVLAIGVHGPVALHLLIINGE